MHSSPESSARTISPLYSPITSSARSCLAAKAPWPLRPAERTTIGGIQSPVRCTARRAPSSSGWLRSRCCHVCCFIAVSTAGSLITEVRRSQRCWMRSCSRVCCRCMGLWLGCTFAGSARRARRLLSFAARAASLLQEQQRECGPRVPGCQDASSVSILLHPHSSQRQLESGRAIFCARSQLVPAAGHLHHWHTITHLR